MLFLLSVTLAFSGFFLPSGVMKSDFLVTPLTFSLKTTVTSDLRLELGDAGLIFLIVGGVASTRKRRVALVPSELPLASSAVTRQV